MRPRFWRMIFGILTFYRNAAKTIDDPAYSMTLGEYLTLADYSESFINDHLLPMGAAIWSTTAAEMKAYPVQAFVRFFESHGLLSLNHRPQWRTVDGGSREYVKRLTAPYRDHIHFASVESIRRNASDVVVRDLRMAISKPSIKSSWPPMLTKRFSFSPIATIANKIFLENGNTRPTGPCYIATVIDAETTWRLVELEFYWRFEHGQKRTDYA